MSVGFTRQAYGQHLSVFWDRISYDFDTSTGRPYVPLDMLGRSLEIILQSYNSTHRVIYTESSPEVTVFNGSAPSTSISIHARIPTVALNEGERYRMEAWLLDDAYGDQLLQQSDFVIDATSRFSGTLPRNGSGRPHRDHAYGQPLSLLWNEISYDYDASTGRPFVPADMAGRHLEIILQCLSSPHRVVFTEASLEVTILQGMNGESLLVHARIPTVPLLKGRRYHLEAWMLDDSRGNHLLDSFDLYLKPTNRVFTDPSASVGTASATGSGDLQADGIQSTPATTGDLQGTGDLQADADRDTAGTASASGSGQVQADTDRDAPGTASATGSGQVQADADRDTTGSASASGTGDVQADAQATGQVEGTASASGTGDVQADADRDTAGTASASGTGDVQADADGDTAGTASASGSGQVQADADGDTAGTASASGSGQVQADAQAAGQVEGTASLSGSGQVQADADSDTAGTASLSGSGQVQADADHDTAASASASGSGQVQADGTVTTASDFTNEFTNEFK